MIKARANNGFPSHDRSPRASPKATARGPAPIGAAFFEIARGSALECGSIQDCLEACNVLTAEKNAQGKTMLIRIVAMLTRLGQRSHEVRENPGRWDNLDYDYDNDNDNEKENGANGST